MALNSSIEWTEATWNPVTGCSHISAGCAHCYAERMALRLQAAGMPKYKNGFEVTTHETELLTPQGWRKPHMVFLCSMGDLFHEHVPFGFILRAFEAMEACPQHQFQVLTKRSKRLRQFAYLLPWPKNVWMGITVEDGRVVSRIDDLRTVPAKVRFLSCEPLIADIGHLRLDDIHWVIVGGESGPGARPMKEDWVLSIRNQCEMAGVAFYFKQWGGPRKHLTGRELDGRIYDAMPVAADRPAATGFSERQRLVAVRD
ncbi:MAG: phage Gp37/Gp68 family protein [candidate division WOR-3 bacterium]|nr:phage Gp37/Gp68 family protein [candidate division WOR-3 bacterium]